MSATRDQSQKVAFVYSNLYQIYQKGKTAAQNASVPSEEAPSKVDSSPVAVSQSHSLQAHSKILKAEDLHQEKPSQKVSSYNPAELIGKRIERVVKRPAVLNVPKDAQAPKHAIVNLKDNLKSLNDLHARLRFMLQELEDLVKE